MIGETGLEYFTKCDCTGVFWTGCNDCTILWVGFGIVVNGRPRLQCHPLESLVNTMFICTSFNNPECNSIASRRRNFIIGMNQCHLCEIG